MSMEPTFSPEAFQSGLAARGVTRFPQLSSAEELQSKVFPPIDYYVEKFITPGLTILGGKPKEGKSWFMLQVGLDVARGTSTLGSLHTKQGNVLYLALEDNERRLNGRMNKLDEDDAWPECFQYSTEWLGLGDGGLEALDAWREAVQNPTLIILDVFAKVKTGRQASESSYEADYAAAAPLQRWAVENGIAVIAIHHTRKMAADDPLEAVSGTNGLTGAADTTLVLKRESINSGDAVLYARGRDIPEVELALSFDQESCRWRVLGEAWEHRLADEKRQVLAALAAIGAPAGVSQLTEYFPDTSEATLRQRLKRMVDTGEIKRVGRGRYEAVTTVTTSQTEA